MGMNLDRPNMILTIKDLTSKDLAVQMLFIVKSHDSIRGCVPLLVCPLVTSFFSAGRNKDGKQLWPCISGHFWLFLGCIMEKRVPVCVCLRMRQVELQGRGTNLGSPKKLNERSSCQAH